MHIFLLFFYSLLHVLHSSSSHAFVYIQTGSVVSPGYILLGTWGHGGLGKYMNHLEAAGISSTELEGVNVKNNKWH